MHDYTQDIGKLLPWPRPQFGSAGWTWCWTVQFASTPSLSAVEEVVAAQGSPVSMSVDVSQIGCSLFRIVLAGPTRVVDSAVLGWLKELLTRLETSLGLEEVEGEALERWLKVLPSQ